MIIPLNWKMLTKEYTILEPFTRALWQPLTFRQIKELSGNKSDNYVHSTLKAFVKSSILVEKKVGNSILYSISKNVFALNTSGYIAEHKADKSNHLPHQNIQKILDRIKTPFFSFIITGSYAKKTQNKTSDIDILIISDDNQNPNAILSEIKLEAELMTPEVHPYVFTRSQFLEMLINKEENYGKEAARDNLIITGGKQFYSIIIEGIARGFNG